MSLRCLLVDDEPPALQVLRTYIERTGILAVVGECHNAFDAMRVLRETPVDLVFMDVRMPGMLGTELLRTLRHPPKVIFTTAHAEFAVDGFDLEAVDFLLKPYSLERFLKAVNKVAPAVAEPPAVAAPPAASEGGLPDVAFLYFRVDRKMVRVDLAEIVYVESLRDYVKIVLEGRKALLVKKPITSLEEMLPRNRFVRVHRSFIVAIGRVTAYTQHDVEVDGVEIPIGKLYSLGVRQALGFR